MCKPDSKLNDVGYRLEGRVYSQTEALHLLTSTMGFSEADANQYLTELPQEAA
jgi:hypothetical protein